MTVAGVVSVVLIAVAAALVTPGFSAPARFSAWFFRSLSPLSLSLNIALAMVS